MTAPAPEQPADAEPPDAEPPGTPEPVVGTRRAVWLAVEYAFIFFVVAGAFALAKVPGGPIPVLLVLAVASVFYPATPAGLRPRCGLRTRSSAGSGRARAVANFGQPALRHSGLTGRLG